MTSSDPYNPIVAFDDVYGDEHYGIVTGADIDPIAAAERIYRRHRRRRLLPPLHIVGAEDDPTYRTFEEADVAYRVVGASYEPRYRHFQEGDRTYRLIGDAAADLPVYGDLYQKFSSAVPSDKYVRLDDADSYAAFREARRQPHVAALEARLAALEDAFARHAADADAHGEATLRAANSAARGGSSIALPVSGECAPGAIECWQDGGEILATIRVPGPDGEARMVTTGAPAAQHLEDVLGCAMEENAEPEEILVAVPPLAQVVGGEALVHQLCRVVGEMVARADGAPHVAVLRSTTDPALAAAMALLQRCQGGDAAACADARRLAARRGSLIADASERLSMAQSMKARGRLS